LVLLENGHIALAYLTQERSHLYWLYD
jgi:hypothetical protein